MNPETIQQLLNDNMKHDPEILSLEQSVRDLRKKAEAEGIRASGILIPPCSAIAIQFKVYGLLINISKLPTVTGLTDTEIVSAVTKAVTLTGLVNSIINIVNIKLIENEKNPKKHGLSFKVVSDELYYSLEREPIYGPDYVYKVRTVSNCGEILDTKIQLSQIIKQLLANPSIPLDQLAVSIDGGTTTFSEWMTDFRMAMIRN